MQSYWFGDVDENGCTPYRGGPEALAKRLETIKIASDRFVPFDWKCAPECSFTSDRGEYLGKLRELCFFLAEAGIIRQYESRDAVLLQMVRTLDQLDEVSNVLTERAVEWHRINNPAFSRKYMRLPRQKLLPMMKRGGSPAFRQIISEIENLASARTALMKEVSRRADEVVPNCSALLGGLVAARLDQYRQELAPEFIEVAQAAIDKAGSVT
jgi:nucleolar protein 56